MIYLRDPAKLLFCWFHVGLAAIGLYRTDEQRAPVPRRPGREATVCSLQPVGFRENPLNTALKE